VEAAAMAVVLRMVGAARPGPLAAAAGLGRARRHGGEAGLALVLGGGARPGLGRLEASGMDAARAPRSAGERAVGPLVLAWFAALPLLQRR
jgi:hypothetical protein